MDRDHSSLIIILLGGILFVLGGILFVLLVGRDTAISVGRDVAIPVMGGAFGVALVVVTRSAVAISLHSMARLHWSSCGSWPCYPPYACGRPYECVGQSPLYWLPASLVLVGALVWWVEDFIIRRRKSRSPAASRLCSGQ